MPSRPSKGELTAGGMAAMQAVHAVIEMATASPLRGDELTARFSVLSRMNADAADGIAGRAFMLALTRMLFFSVHMVGAPMKNTVALMSREQVMTSLLTRMRDEELGVQKVTQAAFESHTLAGFIRAVGYGAESPATQKDLATAAAVALRELLRVRGGASDPLRRWITLGYISNTVVGAHYL